MNPNDNTAVPATDAAAPMTEEKKEAQSAEPAAEPASDAPASDAAAM